MTHPVPLFNPAFLYHCECNDFSCHLMISTKAYEKVRKSISNELRQYTHIMHPDCKDLPNYKIVQEFEGCVLVEG